MPKLMKIKVAALILPCLGSLLALSACGGGSIASTPTPTVSTTPQNSVTTVTVSPGVSTLQPGQSVQLSATVNGTGTFTTGVSWMVNNIAKGSAAVGTISDTGLYVTPYPAPATITVTATSTFDPTRSGTAAITVSAPAAAAAPALFVDAAAQTHAINPYIYGMNFYSQQPSVASAAGLSIDRWGGNATTRYNYKLDATNVGADWYFEVDPNANTAYPDVSDFNSQVVADKAAGARTMGTVPVIGWSIKSRTKACSFSVAKYGPQQKTDPYWADCGNGVHPDGTNITNNDPTDTGVPIDETFAGGWVSYLVGRFGDAAHGGVAVYCLDNEPTWWDANHRDVHPLPFTYDELSQQGIKVAKAVKAADPTAEVSGPVIDFWPAYFYSKKDIVNGWSSGPNYVYNGNPIDRLAHGNVPLIEYYLQQFKAAQDADVAHTRFLDYLDLHTYFAANNAAFNTAGTADQQQAIINSTRVFWDPTYTDPNYTDPDDTSKTPKPLAPQMIPRMKEWIATDYPGTKTAITEYNWGAQEHISGAIAQADILGIFGREGLDLATLWGPPDSLKQLPGLMAFEVFRNYDGAKSGFGSISLTANSADQGKLAVYAALRSSDNVVTVVVINKTFGDLSGAVQLANLTASGDAKVFQYSNADLTTIQQLANVAVTPPPSGTTTSTITGVTFPAMSITVFAVPKL